MALDTGHNIISFMWSMSWSIIMLTGLKDNDLIKWFGRRSANWAEMQLLWNNIVSYLHTRALSLSRSLSTHTLHDSPTLPSYLTFMPVHCIVLYCIVLYCTELYCIVLHVLLCTTKTKKSSFQTTYFYNKAHVWVDVLDINQMLLCYI